MKTGLLLSLLAAIVGNACSHPRISTVPTPSDASAHPELGCDLAVRREGAGLGLTFVLSNRSTAPKAIHYFRPFLQFDLRVLSDGRDLHIVRGDFDGPAAPAELQIPAGETAKLETPVTLRPRASRRCRRPTRPSRQCPRWHRPAAPPASPGPYAQHLASARAPPATAIAPARGATPWSPARSSRPRTSPPTSSARRGAPASARAAAAKAPYPRPRAARRPRRKTLTFACVHPLQ